jgi:ribosome-associated protein
MQTFSLDGHPHVALCDLLKLEGLADSGGAAKQLIDDGMVSVNGQTELRRRCKITSGQQVEMMGQTIVVTD